MCYVNSDLYLLQHKLIGFYNRYEKCLQRGTDWAFKYSGLRPVFQRLNKATTNTQVFPIPNTPWDENSVFTRTSINNNTQYVFHSVWFILQWNITTRILGQLKKKRATGMRKLAESSQQCLHEIASWNGRKVCLYQVWNSRYGVQMDDGLVSFQFHHEENQARIRDTMIMTATKTTSPWRGVKKWKLTSWEWRLLGTVSDIPMSAWRQR
jgi:hypothetical protein